MKVEIKIILDFEISEEGVPYEKITEIIKNNLFSDKNIFVDGEGENEIQIFPNTLDISFNQF